MDLHLFTVAHQLGRLLVTPLLVTAAVCATWGLSATREES